MRTFGPVGGPRDAEGPVGTGAMTAVWWSGKCRAYRLIMRADVWTGKSVLDGKRGNHGYLIYLPSFVQTAYTSQVRTSYPLYESTGWACSCMCRVCMMRRYMASDDFT